MICRGHVPQWKGMNSDSVKFLSYFCPKGKTLTVPMARAITRSLHLAFKTMDPGEVYDILMEQFLEAASRYDPDYAQKVKLVAETIDHELSKSKQIRTVDVNRHLEFDADRHLRFLARRGFLQAVKGKDGRISAWVRSGLWPPPAEFFESGPVGFAYYVQTWFRYYLQQWIEHRRSELETKEGVYTLDLHAGGVPNSRRMRTSNQDGTFIREGSEEVVSAHGRHYTCSIRSLADNELFVKPLDISKLNIQWVDHTEDPLFRDLTRNQRYAIYLTFVRTLKLKDLASSLGMRKEEARQFLAETLLLVRQRADLY